MSDDQPGPQACRKTVERNLANAEGSLVKSPGTIPIPCKYAAFFEIGRGLERVAVTCARLGLETPNCSGSERETTVPEPMRLSR